MTSKALTSTKLILTTLLVLPLTLAAGCGTDERILGVNGQGASDTGVGADDDDGAGTDDDVFPDDDTPAPTPAPTTTGRPTTPTPAPAPATLTSDLLKECDADADCGGGLVCLRSESSEFLGGGPASGMCTLPCASDLDCQAVDSNGFCLPVSETELFCTTTCIPGDVLLGEAKCGGRLDMACESIVTDTAGFDFCRPMCGTNAECPSGRFCDLGVGVCVDMLFDGGAIGAECDPNGDGLDCQSGLCLPFTETYGSCSGLCRTGTVGCGSGDATPDDPSEPICLALFDEVGLDGDVGLCLQRCNCDLDCVHPDAKCFQPAETEEEAIAFLGTVGICVDGEVPEDAQDLRIGIECEDGREPPIMSDSGPIQSDAMVPPAPGDGGREAEPEPLSDSGPTVPMSDAASDGG